MVDGTYQVTADTPLGRKAGVLTLRGFADGTPSARLTVRGITATISETTRAGQDGFCAKGELRAILGRMPFTCEGSVQGDMLTCTATTAAGVFSIDGTRKR